MNFAKSCLRYGGGMPSTANSFHRPQGGPPPSKREVFGEWNCNGWMHLQPSVAPPSPVGARIARPFIPDVIMTLRAGARRDIGATAKPLYAIDGKAEGLDRRSPKTSLFEGGGPPAGGGRSSYPMRQKAFSPAVRSKKPFSNFICFIYIICPTHIRHMMFFSLF